VWLGALPTRAEASVQDDFHLLVPDEIGLEIAPEVGLVARDDEEVSDHLGGSPSGEDAGIFRYFERFPFGAPRRWHVRSPGTDGNVRDFYL
jgi:hypothetical protein